MALNPVPEMVTVAPTGPLLGVKLRMETTLAAWLVMPSRLPAASY